MWSQRARFQVNNPHVGRSGNSETTALPWHSGQPGAVQPGSRAPPQSCRQAQWEGIAPRCPTPPERTAGGKRPHTAGEEGETCFQLQQLSPACGLVQPEPFYTPVSPHSLKIAVNKSSIVQSSLLSVQLLEAQTLYP